MKSEGVWYRKAPNSALLVKGLARDTLNTRQYCSQSWWGMSLRERRSWRGLALLIGLYLFLGGGAQADDGYYAKFGYGWSWPSGDAVFSTDSTADSSSILFPQANTSNIQQRAYSDGRAYKFGAGRAFARHWRVEGSFSYEDVQFKPGAATTAASSAEKIARRGVGISVWRDFALLTPRIRPYLGVGLAGLQTSLSGETARQWAVHTGAGLALTVAPQWVVDVSYQYLRGPDIEIKTPNFDFNSPSRAQYWQLALRYHFGTAKAPAIVDSDGDGVSDIDDRCPQTRLGAVVDLYGCADSDGDGIIDPLDLCPLTPAGNEVDSNGCMDSDNDGVKNSADQCPNSAPGERVQRNGCATRQSVALESIRFAVGDTGLSAEAYARLEAVTAVMAASPQYRLAVQGHSDNSGSEEANYRLSRVRARAVAGALIDLGVAAERIDIQAFGASMPIADNSTSEGRARNRRVSLKVIRLKM